MAGAAAVVSILSTGYSIYSGYQQKQEAEEAAAEQERAGRENAALIESETRESVRRGRDEADRREGEAKARAAASGASGGGMYDFIGDMENEHDRQLAWMAQAGETRAMLAEMNADMQADITRSQGEQMWNNSLSQAFSGVGDVYTYGNAANWWT